MSQPPSPIALASAATLTVSYAFSNKAEKFFLYCESGLRAILILMGVVVNNGIVLIDRINQLRAEGWSRYEAIVQSGRDRLRPILMTIRPDFPLTNCK